MRYSLSAQQQRYLSTLSPVFRASLLHFRSERLRSVIAVGPVLSVCGYVYYCFSCGTAGATVCLNVLTEEPSYRVDGFNFCQSCADFLLLH